MKQVNNYAFIDSQNLNLGVQTLGWKVDHKKFRLFLKNKYHVTKAFMFIGRVGNNQKLYANLRNAGFILIFKPTVQYLDNGKRTVKGNVDAELVLHSAAIEYRNYDKAIIVSGDGDFRCLLEFLDTNNKLLHVFAPNNKYSRLLGPFARYIIQIGSMRKAIEYTPNQNKKTSIGGRSKP